MAKRDDRKQPKAKDKKNASNMEIGSELKTTNKNSKANMEVAEEVKACRNNK